MIPVGAPAGANAAVPVATCPSKAMSKGENGVVSVDPSICIGCRRTVLWWPLGG